MPKEDESGQQKTEDPTERRREKARDKGKIARSQDITSVAVLIASTIALAVYGDDMTKSMTEFIKYILININKIELTSSSFSVYVHQYINYFVASFASVLIIIMIGGIIGNMAQDKFKINFSKKALKPKFSSINPLKGFKELFSKKSVVELLKGILKFGVVGWIAYSVIRNNLQSNKMWAIHNKTVAEMLSFWGGMVLTILIKSCIALFLLAIADFAYQKWEHEQELKMTKQEVKDEKKQYEGNPETKSRIRSQQKEMSQNRMMSDVPDATVVVTNPTFIALAIKYEPENREDAPELIAKGKRKVAQKIKNIAKEHDIPIVENKPLARTLYEVVEIGMEIPPNFYQAMAEILAQIYQENKNQRPNI